MPGQVIKATTPRTPNAPRPFETPETKKKAADLLASTEQYRLNIEANPTVPVLKIYAQAPSAEAAGQLANAAVDGLRDYLQQIAAARGTPADKRVRLEQFGRAEGSVINGGVRIQATVLAFAFFFLASAAAGIFIARVRRGFKLADEDEEHGPRPGDGPPPAVRPSPREHDVVAR